MLRFHPRIAPYKAAVLPLSKKPELTGPAGELAASLRRSFMCDYDETQSIGRRYRRQDELGTPFCITYDFDTLEDRAVTVRDRDSMDQERVALAEVDEQGKTWHLRGQVADERALQDWLQALRTEGAQPLQWGLEQDGKVLRFDLVVQP